MHHVGAQRSHKAQVIRATYRMNLSAHCLGYLNCKMPDTAACSIYEYPLAGMFPDLAGPLRAIIDRLVDLHPVTKINYYHPTPGAMGPAQVCN
ncbi:unnamed protein product [marine sediment metagenome]|uniref:Uncharacterized protein n=1 Tax=marine sediment metagenome TaxID=412755 RepID=X1B4Y9_9ZZZZ